MNRVQIMQGEKISEEMKEEVLCRAIDNLLESDDFVLVTRNKGTKDFMCQSRFISRNRTVLQVMGKIVETMKSQIKGDNDAV